MSASPHNNDTAQFAGRLTAVIVLVVLANVSLWLGGFRDQYISNAVEVGVARAEERAEEEQQKPHQIRQAIADQRDTVVFWRTIWLLGDFFGEPALIILRTLGVTVAFAALAALLGRPVLFEESLSENSQLQVFWAAGAVALATLHFALPQGTAETSLTLALRPGEYPAIAWFALRQLDLFALVGWTFIGIWAWRRGQAPFWAAPFVIGFLMFGELWLRTSMVLGMEMAMRLATGEPN